jgi:thiosulfate reductase cytochrome b subunit
MRESPNSTPPPPGARQDHDRRPGRRPLVRRHGLGRRLAHWVWAVSLLFLATSGLNIFLAHPVLHIGKQSGFEFDNSVLAIGAVRDADGERIGVTEIFGHRFETTGLLGVSGGHARAVPSWVTTPSFPDLATARVIHFFFAWTLVAAFALWLVAGLRDGHLRRNVLPRRSDVRGAFGQCRRYLRFDFREEGGYNPLQRVSYAVVLLVLLPLAVLTGLAMSPAAHAIFPALGPMFGGRETARTLHFVVMVLLAVFAVLHVALALLVRPSSGLRSIVTGWARAPAGEEARDDPAREEARDDKA